MVWSKAVEVDCTARLEGISRRRSRRSSRWQDWFRAPNPASGLLAPGISAGLMIGPDHQNAGQFAMGAGRRLKGNCIHAADFGKAGFERVLNIQRALDPVRRACRDAPVREAVEPRHALVDFRDCTSSCRIPEGKDRDRCDSSRSKGGEMPDHIDFAQFRHAFDAASEQASRDRSVAHGPRGRHPAAEGRSARRPGEPSSKTRRSLRGSECDERSVRAHMRASPPANRFPAAGRFRDADKKAVCEFGKKRSR